MDILIDLWIISKKEEFKNVIKDKDISLIAVDEAHTILWGENFREAFFNISNFTSW